MYLSNKLDQRLRLKNTLSCILFSLTTVVFKCVSVKSVACFTFPRNTSTVFCEMFVTLFLCVFAMFFFLLVFSSVAVQLTSQGHRTSVQRTLFQNSCDFFRCFFENLSHAAMFFSTGTLRKTNHTHSVFSQLYSH